MKVKLIVIGKTNSHYLLEGEKNYEKRLKHYCKFSELIVTDVKNGNKLSKNELKNKEGKLILKKLNTDDDIILLDENGGSFSSLNFSQFLEKKLSSTKTLVFIVGGAFGFSDEIYRRCNFKLSLSKMTFSHQMVRLIFKEQLYRAFTINKRENYHHD
jgi:23S rRNA (pseudouridine1915-N3)-methyltransferase